MMFSAYVYDLGNTGTGWTSKDGFKTKYDAMQWVRAMWRQHNNGRPSSYEIKRDEKEDL